MLVVKAFINEKQIEEIHIWNTGNCTSEAMQTYEYKIVKPEGYEKFPIFHMRELGWMNLMAQAIDVIERIEPTQKAWNKKWAKEKKKK